MKYAAEMGSGPMTYIPSFIKNVSSIQKLMKGDTQTQTAGERISLILFLQNKKSKLNIGAKTLHILSYIRLTLTMSPCERNRLLFGRTLLIPGY
jgi:hypothetical protein